MSAQPSTLKRLLKTYVLPHWRRILIALAMMCVVAGATAAFASGIEVIFDKVFKADSKSILFYAGIGILVLFLVKGAASYGQSVIMSQIGQKIIAQLQSQMFRKMIRAELGYFHQNPTGSLVSRYTNDVNLLRNAVSTSITSMGKDFLTLLFLIGVMFSKDWLLTTVTFVVIPTVILPLIRYSRKLKNISIKTQERTGILASKIDQIFQGIRHVKAYTMEKHEMRSVDATIQELYTSIYQAAKSRAMSQPIMEAFGGITIVLVIIYGGYQVIDGTKTTGTFFAFIVSLLLAYEPMRRLARINADIQEGLAAATRIFEVLDREESIKNPEKPKPLALNKGEVQFCNVSFSYHENAPALHGINLIAQGGKTTALVGHSGSGKSTILNLIPRFYDINSGQLTIDGIEIRDLALQELRGTIGLVSQEVSLFDDTIENNIRYGKPNCSFDEVIAAARKADAHSFIEALPEGYQTRVGERGVRLSGGQRQRLSIARALLKNAPILLLDEATSSLDTESEQKVQQALEVLMQGRTTIVIAHRLSTIQNADLIHVIANGKVAESGTHAELIALNGIYDKLCKAQELR